MGGSRHYDQSFESLSEEFDKPELILNPPQPNPNKGIDGLDNYQEKKPKRKKKKRVKKRPPPQHHQDYDENEINERKGRKSMDLSENEILQQARENSKDNTQAKEFDKELNDLGGKVSSKFPKNREHGINPDYDPDMEQGMMKGELGNKRKIPREYNKKSKYERDMYGGPEDEEEYEEEAKELSFNEKFSKYFELCFAILTGIIIANYFIGKNQILSYMEKWYSVNKEFFDNNYSHIGEEEEYSLKNTFPLKRESVTEFRFYASGRIYLKWIVINIEVSLLY